MPPRLAGPAVFARVEKGKQLLLRVGWPFLPRFQASIRCLQVILLKKVRLLFVQLRGENEVFRYDRKLIENQQVGWVCGGDVNNVQIRYRVLKWINLQLGRSIHTLWCRFFGE